METKIDRIRELAVASINKSGDAAAAMCNPTHDMVEGTKVFIQGAVDFLCSLIDIEKLERNDPPDEAVADALASRVVNILHAAIAR